MSVTDLVHTMSIAEDAEKWAAYIEATRDYERRSHVEEMRKAGFDVSGQAVIMTSFYETGKWKKGLC